VQRLDINQLYSIPIDQLIDEDYIKNKEFTFNSGLWFLKQIESKNRIINEYLSNRIDKLEIDIGSDVAKDLMKLEINEAEVDKIDEAE
jgi:hypothetical protein